MTLNDFAHRYRSGHAKFKNEVWRPEYAVSLAYRTSLRASASITSSAFWAIASCSPAPAVSLRSSAWAMRLRVMRIVPAWAGLTSIQP